MKWINLKNKYFFFTVFFANIIYYNLYGQENGVNLIMVIDEEIVTKNLTLTFKSGQEKYEYGYSLGKPIVLPINLFANKMIILDFDFMTKLKSDYNHNYNYSFEFKKGWLNNTDFLVIRIYNLNHEKYKKKYCGSTGNYVVEVQNSVYYQSVPKCYK